MIINYMFVGNNNNDNNMKITLRVINALNPCYNPEYIGFTEDLELTALEFIEQFGEKVKSKENIIWLLCRNQFMPEKYQTLFAVWCVRIALSFHEEVDYRSVEACDVSERFALNNATVDELAAAWSAARAAAWSAAESAAWSAESAAWSAESAAWSGQLNKLKEFFTTGKMDMSDVGEITIKKTK